MSNDGFHTKLDMSLQLLTKVADDTAHNKEALAAQAVSISTMQADISQLNKTIHLGNGVPGLVTRTELLENELNAASKAVDGAHRVAGEALNAASEAREAAHNVIKLVDNQKTAKEVAVISSKTKMIAHVIMALGTIIGTVIATYFTIK